MTDGNRQYLLILASYRVLAIDPKVCSLEDWLKTGGYTATPTLLLRLQHAYIQTAKEATLRFRTRNNILKLSDDDVSIESYLNPNPSPEQQDNSQDQETLKQQVHPAGQSDDEDEDMWEAVTSPPRTTRTSAENLPDPGPPPEEEEMEDHQETLAAANDLLVTHTTVSHHPRMEDLEAQGSSPTDELATLFTKEWNQWYSRVGSQEVDPPSQVQYEVMLSLFRDEVRQDGTEQDRWVKAAQHWFSERRDATYSMIWRWESASLSPPATIIWRGKGKGSV